MPEGNEGIEYYGPAWTGLAHCSQAITTCTSYSPAIILGECKVFLVSGSDPSDRARAPCC